MSLDSSDYRFIIGKDLIPILFPENIPSIFYLQTPIQEVVINHKFPHTVPSPVVVQLSLVN